MSFDFLNPDSYKNAYEDVKDAVVGGYEDIQDNVLRPAENFLKNHYSRNGEWWGALIDPWAAISRMAIEGFNEISGANKKRERDWQDKKAGEEEAARMGLRNDEIRRRGLLDEMASLAAAGGRRGRFGSNFTGMFADEESGGKDLLGM